ncbi:MAG TPA: hypothetical protein VFU29_04370 [Chitinophagaceae bacterium]|nr:hypothetical protein [Chitinophagaceae bacterium]
MEPLTTTANKWTFTQKIFFRFFFVYFVLYCFPFPIVSFQLTQPLIYPFTEFVEWLVPKVGRLFFNVSLENPSYFEYRFGDFVFEAIYLFIITVVALMVSLVWSVMDRRRLNYEKLERWFLLYIRYFLAFKMLVYGMHKVIPLQGGFITASTLEQPFGMMEPSSLQWNFLAYSNAYKIFTGLGELLGGLLILWRRTGTLGALILTAVLSVVVMINFCFIMVVKSSSSHYLFIAFIILWNDRERLLNILIFNKPTVSRVYPPLIKSRKWMRFFSIFLITLVMWMLYQHISWNHSNWKRWSTFSHRPLYGVYTTDYFIRGDDTTLPLQTDSLRWKRITIAGVFSPQVYIHLSTDSVISSRVQTDTVQKTIQFEIKKDTLKMNWSRPDSNHLFFSGKWKNDSIKVMMKNYDLNNYPLYREKFQWIYD